MYLSGLLFFVHVLELCYMFGVSSPNPSKYRGVFHKGNVSYGSIFVAKHCDLRELRRERPSNIIHPC